MIIAALSGALAPRDAAADCISPCPSTLCSAVQTDITIVEGRTNEAGDALSVEKVLRAGNAAVPAGQVLTIDPPNRHPNRSVIAYVLLFGPPGPGQSQRVAALFPITDSGQITCRTWEGAKVEPAGGPGFTRESLVAAVSLSQAACFDRATSVGYEASPCQDTTGLGGCTVGARAPGRSFLLSVLLLGGLVLVCRSRKPRQRCRDDVAA